MKFPLAVVVVWCCCLLSVPVQCQQIDGFDLACLQNLFDDSAAVNALTSFFSMNLQLPLITDSDVLSFQATQLSVC